MYLYQELHILKCCLFEDPILELRMKTKLKCLDSRFPSPPITSIPMQMQCKEWDSKWGPLFFNSTHPRGTHHEKRLANRVRECLTVTSLPTGPWTDKIITKRSSRGCGTYRMWAFSIFQFLRLWSNPFILFLLTFFFLSFHFRSVNKNRSSLQIITPP